MLHAVINSKQFHQRKRLMPHLFGQEAPKMDPYCQQAPIRKASLQNISFASTGQTRFLTIATDVPDKKQHERWSHNQCVQLLSALLSPKSCPSQIWLNQSRTKKLEAIGQINHQFLVLLVFPSFSAPLEGPDSSLFFSCAWNKYWKINYRKRSL